jgi:hypothetical protein
MTTSAFGIEHGRSGIAKAGSREREKHYGRMAAATGTMGGATGALGGVSYGIGRAEAKGKDPVGFLTRRTARSKPVSHAVKMKVLPAIGAEHRWQGKASGALGAGTLAVAGGYKLKQRRERQRLGMSKRSSSRSSPAFSEKTKRRAGDVALGAGTAGTAGTVGYFGARTIPNYAYGSAGGAMDAAAKQRTLHNIRRTRTRATPNQVSWLKQGRNTHLRLSGVKGSGAAAATVAAGAGAAGLAELGRHGVHSVRNRKRTS